MDEKKKKKPLIACLFWKKLCWWKHPLGTINTSGSEQPWGLQPNISTFALKIIKLLNKLNSIIQPISLSPPHSQENKCWVYKIWTASDAFYKCLSAYSEKKLLHFILFFSNFLSNIFHYFHLHYHINSNTKLSNLEEYGQL